MITAQATSNLKTLMSEVWNKGSYSNLSSILTEQYEVISDPGDPWNGQKLSRPEFERRVDYTRNAFPDIHFDVQEYISGGNVIAIRWLMSGTHKGDLDQLPATNKRFAIEGMTFYYFEGERICGHRQAFDRLGFLAQIGVLALV